jgi:trimeric autotransporter adhesin
MRQLSFLFLFFSLSARAQSPVNMSTQPALTYIESFDSIQTWTNNFSSGYGANRFASVAIGGTNSIPDPQKITTSSSAFVTGSSGGLQKDTVSGKMMMLATGTADNTNSVAFDFFLNFSGINAGQLSFQYSTVFNGGTTSNRKGTLKVYASVDGVNFTELTTAQVTITNYVPGSGTIQNVQLPTSFNNSLTARLRFYYYNSSGGTTGSRPLIALKNLKVTASGVLCTTPTISPTSLTFTSVTAISVQGSFVAALPSPDEYMVVITSNNSLTANPVDSFAYNIGDNVGDGIVVYRGSSTSFSATNLNPSTTYKVFIFPVNIYCNGSIRYKTSGVLNGTVTTTAGPPCQQPITQPTNIQFSNITTSSISGSFIASPNATEYLVVASIISTLTSTPINGTVYNAGDALGGGLVVYRGSGSNFIASSLNHSSTYNFFVFSLNNYACSNGPVYLTTSPLTGQQSTATILPCTTPAGSGSNLIFKPDVDKICGFFSPYNQNTDGYLVIISTSGNLSQSPQNGVSYNIGDVMGQGKVISTGANYSFIADSLSQLTTYYFFIYSYNSVCIGGPLYQTANVLSGNCSTVISPANKVYFGNLHAHSSFSDGNKDDTSHNPSFDYDYARNAMCMDFLGISEHNHFTSSGNPGMLLSKYQLGISQANNYTASNPGFLALYGMEWGVISNGGHVLVYGVDSLLGWETLNGSPNYDRYVAKNDYLSSNGLFSQVNQFKFNQSFATLAHPGWYDFQNLVNIPYNSSVDSALVGVAIESGPAFSTSTTYNDAGGSMVFLPYYEEMLAKGYHIAPLIDHDNHNTTFGTTAYTRTAVIAPSIAKSDFMEAMNNRSFYATQSCNTTLNFSVYGQEMGAIMTHPDAPAIALTISAPYINSPIIKLLSGEPGSGYLPVVIASDTGSKFCFTDIHLPDSSSAYYFADISIDGKRSVTAPIWYTRHDLPLSIHTDLLDKTFDFDIKTNPSAEVLILSIHSQKKQTGQLIITSMYGQQLINESVVINYGETEASFNTTMLSPGLYIAVLEINGMKIARKFSHF